MTQAKMDGVSGRRSACGVYYVGYIYETFSKIKVLNVANGAKDTIDNKQEGVLPPNLHFRVSSV